MLTINCPQVRVCNVLLNKRSAYFLRMLSDKIKIDTSPTSSGSRRDFPQQLLIRKEEINFFIRQAGLEPKPSLHDT